MPIIQGPEIEYDFFIAHSASDARSAMELRAALQREYRVFSTPSSLVAGVEWGGAIASALAASAVTVVLVSPGTTKAFYQQEEIARAISRARQDASSHRVVPVLLGGATEWPYGLAHVQAILLGKRSRAKEAVPYLRRSIADLAARYDITYPDSARAYAMVRGSSQGAPWWYQRFGARSELIRRPISGWLASSERSLSRLRSPLYVFYFDLDRFGAINSRYGTDVGDAVLKSVGSMLRPRFSRGAFERLSQDEYIGVATAMTGRTAERAADECVRLVAERDWTTTADRLFVTTSCGISRWSKRTESAESAAMRAVIGCHAVKRVGGNGMRHNDGILSVSGVTLDDWGS